MKKIPDINDLRRFAVRRSLFEATTLKTALRRQGFVQADPIRAPARAQDLTLRQRVKDYRAGDLERLYTKLELEEDFFIMYGFVTRELQALMHPRPGIAVSAWGGRAWPPARQKQALDLLAFVRECGEAHPRDVDRHFAHGKVQNYWGGSSNATTHLLDALHYRGLLRVARRDNGIRVYAVREHGPGAETPAVQLDRLADAAVRLYAPLPAKSLAMLMRHLRHGVPQWRGELTEAIKRAKQRLAKATIDGTDWYWPAEEKVNGDDIADRVRLLAPFDPVVRDRERFARLWNWEYRFEAYTPAPKRKLGYYALPLLWRDRVIGWGNIGVSDGAMTAEIGYVAGKPPRDRAFRTALEAELDAMRVFLGL